MDLKHVFVIKEASERWQWGHQGPSWYNAHKHPDVLSFNDLLRQDPRAGAAYRQVFQSEIDIVSPHPEQHDIPPEEAKRLTDPKTDPMSVFGIMSFFFPGEEPGEWFVFMDGGSNPTDGWLLWDKMKWVGQEDSEQVSNGMVSAGTPEQDAKIDRLYDKYPKIAKGVPGARQR